ncbi:dTDP-4-dehydrorhamnose reductase [Shewanella sp. UCD-KL12]|uniref:dTDP-4-dehydrorhamnose reductase n=1 Tax=Shewanella sp. UCD-KL12 TaxID=1917163 RepID=UPI000970526C|nr:dTDP-4-dehydrorhamnose reductase [Shewanella sp. UCD-KL12]
MNVLIIGKHGQLALTLMHSYPNNIEPIAMGRNEIDLSSTATISSVINQHNIALIINTAAYTNVELAENNIADAFYLNEIAAGNIAAAANIAGIKLIHLSTDYLFDGAKVTPYTTMDKPSPLNIYGLSKLKGEAAIKRLENSDFTIIRSSWLYSIAGDNFLLTMLRLMQERDSLHVIDDQVSCPTSTYELAKFIWKIAAQQHKAPTYHWTDLGKASWFEFACSIQDIAFKLGKITKKIPIVPITSSEYGSLAVRPSYSKLDISESQAILEAKPWQQNLEAIIKSL